MTKGFSWVGNAEFNQFCHPSAALCCHQVQSYAATFGHHQKVCKNLIHAEGVRLSSRVRLGRGKVRFADNPEAWVMNQRSLFTRVQQ
jgi:hypothetical protein